MTLPPPPPAMRLSEILAEKGITLRTEFEPKPRYTAPPATGERAEFEAWASHPGRHGKLPVDAHPNGAYKDTRTYTAYYAWAAAKKTQAQQVAVPAGWVLVPIEPTEEMIVAGQDLVVHDTAYEDYRGVYKAMLAAAQGAKP